MATNSPQNLSSKAVEALVETVARALAEVSWEKGGNDRDDARQAFVDRRWPHYVLEANAAISAMTNGVVSQALTGAFHALRSYQFGNSSSELAEEIADACEEALSAIGKPI